jgi:hypothetical protein
MSCIRPPPCGHAVELRLCRATSDTKGAGFRPRPERKDLSAIGESKSGRAMWESSSGQGLPMILAKKILHDHALCGGAEAHLRMSRTPSDCAQMRNIFAALLRWSSFWAYSSQRSTSSLVFGSRGLSERVNAAASSSVATMMWPRRISGGSNLKSGMAKTASYWAARPRCCNAPTLWVGPNLNQYGGVDMVRLGRLGIIGCTAGDDETEINPYARGGQMKARRVFDGAKITIRGQKRNDAPIHTFCARLLTTAPGAGSRFLRWGADWQKRVGH